MPTHRMRVLSLYKALLRESQKFSVYNYRMYAQRRIRDAFRDNKTVEDSEKIQELLKFGEKNIETIKRQVTVGLLYKDMPTILEVNKGEKER